MSSSLDWDLPPVDSFLPHSNHSVFRIHCSGAPVFLSRSLLQTVATGLRNQIVAVPYVGNEPRPRFPRRSVLRVVKVCARGSKTATIVFEHLSDQRGHNAKRWNENSSDRNRCTNHKSRNCYSRMQSTRDIKMCSRSACHLRIICRLSVADRGLSAYDMKNNLCLFERPFKIQKNCLFLFEIYFSIWKILTFFSSSLLLSKKQISPFATPEGRQKVLLGTDTVPIFS